MKIKINDVLDEFLYRYADEGGNFDDPFLKIVHDLLNVDAIDTSKQYVDKSQNNRHDLTDAEIALKSLYEAIIRYENLSPFPDKYAMESCEYQLHDAKEKARAILRKAQEK